MTSKIISDFAKRADKSADEVQEIWDAAASAARKKFEKENDEFFAYVSRKVQFKLGLASKKTSFKEFADKKGKK